MVTYARYGNRQTRPSEGAEPHPRRGGAEGRSSDRPQSRPIQLDAAADPDVPIQTSENTVDLRGLRAHEAEAMAEQFLDRMMGAGKRVAFLIHGHGTGALRDAVRETMRASPYVARSRADLVIAAAREPKTVKFYDAGHELNDAATHDRLAWLRQSFTLKKLHLFTSSW